MNLLLLLGTAVISTVSATEEPALVVSEAPPFRLGTLTSFGSGCPADSVRLAIDGENLSVLISEFLASTSGHRTRDRKSCNLAIPVDVEPGFSVSISRLDYHGYAYVPSNHGAYSQFNVNYYWGGGQGSHSLQTFQPGFNEDILLSQERESWSPCGVPASVHIDTTLSVSKKERRQDDPEIAIDKVDVMRFKWRRC